MPLSRKTLVAVLLALPFIGLVWVPWYARFEPALFGIPFFYWYQIAWIVLGSLVTGAALVIVRRHDV